MKPSEAYRWLLNCLRCADESRLVYATTNYDVIGEAALGGCNRLVDWGEPPVVPGQSESRVNVGTLLRGIDRFVPVLHLHGRVGWYRRPDGTVVGTNTVRHQGGFGIPVAMLPDPKKVYDQDDVINALWLQLTEALRRAKRVFVLGHSLNDSFLMRSLVTNVQPYDRIAISVLVGSEDPAAERTRGPVGRKVREHLPGAQLIPMQFGVTEAGADEIAAWLDRRQRGAL